MKKSIIALCLCGLLLTGCGSEIDVTDNIGEAVHEESIEEMKTTVNLDDYVGYYTDGENEVEIAENNGNYSMEISLYRLTALDEGIVTAGNDGVIFDTFDANGEPMKVSFKKDGSNSFTLCIEESTWSYLNSGDTFDNMVKTEKK